MLSFEACCYYGSIKRSSAPARSPFIKKLRFNRGEKQWNIVVRNKQVKILRSRFPLLHRNWPLLQKMRGVLKALTHALDCWVQLWLYILLSPIFFSSFLKSPEKSKTIEELSNNYWALLCWVNVTNSWEDVLHLVCSIYDLIFLIFAPKCNYQNNCPSWSP